MIAQQHQLVLVSLSRNAVLRPKQGNRKEAKPPGERHEPWSTAGDGETVAKKEAVQGCAERVR